ncbi:MAG: YdcF family protein, partial [Sinobacteraceae bacterium]|nr:YdcF family protein [Nevskiaceae bacterium]
MRSEAFSGNVLSLRYRAGAHYLVKTLTLSHAARVWNYMSAGRGRAPCDAIVVCCSYDLRVCDYACQLLKQGLARQLVLSGLTGNWTRHLWDMPEAHVFRARAIENGIDPGRILIEDHATNFGENIA